MIINEQDYALNHVGVLGMKWGRRKSSSTASPEHQTVSQLRKKKAHELSNKELKDVAERIRLEQSYRDLNPSSVTKGKKAVSTAFGSVGKVSGFLASLGTLIVIGGKVMNYAKDKGILDKANALLIKP